MLFYTYLDLLPLNLVYFLPENGKFWVANIRELLIHPFWVDCKWSVLWKFLLTLKLICALKTVIYKNTIKLDFSKAIIKSIYLLNLTKKVTKSGQAFLLLLLSVTYAFLCSFTFWKWLFYYSLYERVTWSVWKMSL